MSHSHRSAGLDQLGPKQRLASLQDDPFNKMRGGHPRGAISLRERSNKSAGQRKVKVTLPKFEFKDQ